MTSAAQDVTLLGLCDGELDPKRHQSSYLTNKVGGGPDWCLVAPLQLPRCARCRAPLSHVVQVYCPLQESPYHRTLHLFACPASGCSGRADCWTVLRSQCLEVPVTSSRPNPVQEAPRSATDWCEAADDWGMEEEEEDDGWGGGGGVKKESKVQEEKAAPQIEAGSEMDVSSRLQDLHLAESQQEDDVAPPVFRPFFVSVVEESDLYGEDGELDHAQKLLREYERREGVKVGDMGGDDNDDEGGAGGGGGEKYEKTKARHGDAVFSRFMKKISSCPQQILRYCRGGKPLFISEPPSNLEQVVSRCGSCGGGRTFELQLMPALVSLLREERDGSNGGGGSAEVELEFGAVLVYTCINSCWTSGSDSPVEEFCFVQMDPDQQLFK